MMALLFPWRAMDYTLAGDPQMGPFPYADEPPLEVWEGMVRGVNARRGWWLEIRPERDDYMNGGDRAWHIEMTGGESGPSFSTTIVNSRVERWVVTGGAMGTFGSWQGALIAALAMGETRLMHVLSTANTRHPG